MIWLTEILTRRTVSDKIVHDKAFSVSEDPNYDKVCFHHDMAYGKLNWKNCFSLNIA